MYSRLPIGVQFFINSYEVVVLISDCSCFGTVGLGSYILTLLMFTVSISASTHFAFVLGAAFRDYCRINALSYVVDCGNDTFNFPMISIVVGFNVRIFRFNMSTVYLTFILYSLSY